MNTILILAIIYIVFYAILVWRRLDLGLLVIIAGLPTYLIRLDVFGFPTTILELMLLTAFFIWIIKDKKYNLKKLIRRQAGVINYPFYIEIILWLLIALSAVIIAGFNREALGSLKAYFIEPIIFFILILNTFKKPESYKNIFLALGVSAVVISLAAIYQKITGDFIPNPSWAPAAVRRTTSFFSFPNAVGLYLGPIILLLTGFLWQRFSDLKNLKRKFLEISGLGLIIILALLAIYFAKSEGALIGVAAGLFIFGLMVNKYWRIITLTVLVLGTGFILSNQTAYNYVKDKVTLFDLSGQIRQQQWAETFKMLKDGRMISGSGLANYQNIIKPYHQEGIFVKNNDPDWLRKVRFNAEYRTKVWQPTEIYLYPHNIFLNFWTELGILGLLLFVWLVIKYFIIAFKLFIKKAEGRYIVLGLLSALVMIIVHGLVDVPYFKNDLAILFWLLFSLLGIININYGFSSTKIHRQ